MSALLAVRDLTKHYASRHGSVRAVDDVSFSIAPGETLALVGEYTQSRQAFDLYQGELACRRPF